MIMDPSSAYRLTAGQNAGPIRLVITLYEQLIKDLRRAITAMENKDLQARIQEIDHALRVVGQLQGTLNSELGGEVAKNLDQFYFLVRAKLLEAQISVSPELLREQISRLLLLREAWIEVEVTLAKNELTSPSVLVSTADGDSSSEWRA